MRQIDKTEILSTRYKQWLDKHNRDNVPHPTQSRTYYYDVVMNLLYCQKGVCAYTEMIICNPGLLNEKQWKGGKYNGNKENLGSLEHFDSTLKQDKFWEWDNLFVIHSKINVIKSNRQVDYILKPDSPGYNPMKLLEYDFETHLFIPHTDIPDNKKRQRIKQMIDVLQLNHSAVIYERKTFLTRVSFSISNQRSFEIDRFFTAYQMSKNHLQ